MTGDAYAKAILLGEHVVVEGAPALVAGLAAGMTARVVKRAEALRVSVRPWDLEAEADPEGDAPARALAALDAALAAAGLPERDRQVLVNVEAGVPPSVGLGSSAALAVAVLRAVARAGGRHDLAAAKVAAELAAGSESVFHGRPSGADAAVAAAGGVGVFHPGEGLAPVVPGARSVLVVADTGDRPPTREMIERVRQHRDADAEGAAAYARLGALAAAAPDQLAKGELAALGAAMDEAQTHLVRLGLGTPGLEAACAAAHAAGALGVKLTGAGGGGCVVALARPARAPHVLRALTAQSRWARSFPLAAVATS